MAAAGGAPELLAQLPEQSGDAVAGGSWSTCRWYASAAGAELNTDDERHGRDDPRYGRR
jgi:hypothetical protein